MSGYYDYLANLVSDKLSDNGLPAHDGVSVECYRQMLKKTTFCQKRAYRKIAKTSESALKRNLG